MLFYIVKSRGYYLLMSLALSIETFVLLYCWYWYRYVLDNQHSRCPFLNFANTFSSKNNNHWRQYYILLVGVSVCILFVTAFYFHFFSRSPVKICIQVVQNFYRVTFYRIAIIRYSTEERISNDVTRCAISYTRNVYELPCDNVFLS